VSIDALRTYRVEMTQLKKTEEDLVNALTIFKIDLGASEELKKVEAELVRLEAELKVEEGMPPPSAKGPKGKAGGKGEGKKVARRLSPTSKAASAKAARLQRAADAAEKKTTEKAQKSKSTKSPKGKKK